MLAGDRVHLTRVGATDDPGQIARDPHRFVRRHAVELELEILRKHLPNEHWARVEPCRDHSVAEMRRHPPRAFHDPLRGIARHRRLALAGYLRLHGFLDIDEAEITPLPRPTFDIEKNRVAQQPERAAPFHPVRRIDELHRGAVGAVLSCVANSFKASDANNVSIDRRSFSDSGQKRMPCGSLTVLPAIRSSARCRHDRA